MTEAVNLTGISPRHARITHLPTERLSGELDELRYRTIKLDEDYVRLRLPGRPAAHHRLIELAEAELRARGVRRP